ncbi:MAG: D-aminoacyl-tRNA deacylase [bacterium]|nr:D-aminoacyl-tRNA deacylase [bacterium]
MRLVIQRVKEASIHIGELKHAAIGAGCLVFVGIEESDTEEDSLYVAQKLCNLRIFSDGEGKMNLDIKQTRGELLIVSQFTLMASTKKGNRPSFVTAAKPDKAVPLYHNFISLCSTLIGKPCSEGKFGADMQVTLINDGPVTIILDSKTKE